jgi:hypothetical protein
MCLASIPVILGLSGCNTIATVETTQFQPTTTTIGVTKTLTSVITVTPTVAFSPGTQTTNVPFSTLTYPDNGGGSYTGEGAIVQVYTQKPPAADSMITYVVSTDRAKILDADYSQNFVFLLLNGYRGGIFSNFKVLRVWEDANSIIYIQAHFNDLVLGATSMPASNSQYQIIMITRDTIGLSFELRCKLLDESGTERDNTTIYLRNVMIPPSLNTPTVTGLPLPTSVG